MWIVPVLKKSSFSWRKQGANPSTCRLSEHEGAQAPTCNLKWYDQDAGQVDENWSSKTVDRARPLCLSTPGVEANGRSPVLSLLRLEKEEGGSRRHASLPLSSPPPQLFTLPGPQILLQRGTPQAKKTVTCRSWQNLAGHLPAGLQRLPFSPSAL